jgi:hypothetical protein
MLRLKSCPRCKRGDIGVDKDHHGWYEYCIQCGYIRDLVSMAELGQQAWSRKKVGRKAKILGKER